MSMIGDLERRAGIGASPAEGTAFWRQFPHLEGEACLNAGVAELRRLISSKEPRPAPDQNARRSSRARNPAVFDAGTGSSTSGLCRQAWTALEIDPQQRLDGRAAV